MVGTGLTALAAQVFPYLLERGAGPLLTAEEINGLTADVAQRLGFREACYYLLSTQGRPVVPVAVFGKDDSAWRAQYRVGDLHHHDPAIQSVFRSAFPFTLSELEAARHDSMSHRLFEERRVTQSQDVLVCPVFGAIGELGCLLFVSDVTLDLDSAARLHMRLVSEALISIYRLMSGPETILDGALPSLSRRESECLYWSSQGKSAGDTAAILGISTHTVRGYIESTMAKLGARNREEMVLRAMPLGLLINHR